VCGLGGDDDLQGMAGMLAMRDPWGWSRAWEVASSAGWWWPGHHFLMVCQRPVHLHRRQPDESYFSSRLHNPDGPAVEWADGFALHVWHGTRVPAWVVEDPGVERIVTETDLLVRRCGIESMGLARFVAAAGLRLVDECADPGYGHQGVRLALFDVPDPVNPHPRPVRLLMAIGYDPDTFFSFARDFPRPTFVPASVPAALTAATLTQQVSVDRDTLIALLDAHGTVE
jgi:hypothetical protein